MLESRLHCRIQDRGEICITILTRTSFNRKCWKLLGAIGAVLPCYITCDIILPHSVFWSADEGGKFLQLAGCKKGIPFRFEVPYPAASIDPDYHFYPSHGHYPRKGAGEKIQANWSFVFPLISLPFYKYFGLGGIYLIPLLAGLITAFISGWLAEHIVPRSGVITVIAVGLASPIFFYSQLFWEHTFTVLLCLLAVCFLWRTFDHTGTTCIPITSAALMLGPAIWIRNELIIFAVSLAITYLIVSRQHRCSRLTIFKMVGIIAPLCLSLRMSLIDWNVLLHRNPSFRWSHIHCNVVWMRVNGENFLYSCRRT